MVWTRHILQNFTAGAARRLVLASRRFAAGAAWQQLEASTPRFQPSMYKAMGVRLFKSPGMYAQKPHILEEAGALLQMFGPSCGVVTAEAIDHRYGPRLFGSLDKAKVKATKACMGPEASWEEVERVLEAFKDKGGVHFVVGFGGGKVMDVARVVAHLLKVPHVLIPTLASTDAAGTALGVLYESDGRFKEYFHLPQCAAAVLMDTSVIAESPLRFTVSGLGDAMSTYYEARAVRASGAANLAGGLTTAASWALANACHEALMTQAPRAIQALREGRGVTPELESVIEANTLLSGVGASTCGIAAAHATHNGLTSLPEVHDHKLHGEIVGWTTVVQLLLEGDEAEAAAVAAWNKAVGLPLTLEDMNMAGVEPSRVMRALELACAPSDSMGNMPFRVTADQLWDCMQRADALGRSL